MWWDLGLSDDDGVILISSGLVFWLRTNESRYDMHEVYELFVQMINVSMNSVFIRDQETIRLQNKLRKAGFEAMQRADKSASSSGSFFGSMTSSSNSSMDSSSKKSSSSSPASASTKSYGAWGPVFQDKQNFASMHFC
ncbi:hypothetical protein Fcan01_26682 [Folsomia candida]|uniref:Uncharacterized protein n=1 Tax=Folsomia candida TaxID=158441 RepID=A0A226D0H1_FOLCA|nr:hypothetical protein Fcan01_26682 [Folsomia candida]